MTDMSAINSTELYDQNSTEQGSFIAVHDSDNWLEVLWSHGKIRIPCYSILFLLCIVGNGFVIITLVRDKKMRTVTNVFLLNLSLSDLLLGTFCIPFTLVGTLLREFIFGHAMCRIIPYLQAVCVSVSAWTLVAISIERYYAICHPLQSRKWQTSSHAKKMISAVWFGSLIGMLPIASLSELIPLRVKGKHKCREIWPNQKYEQGFTVVLDFILLIIPLVIMSWTYIRISSTLRNAVRSTSAYKEQVQENYGRTSLSSSSFTCRKKPAQSKRTVLAQQINFIRATNVDKALQQKKRVIIMLIVVVMEFFICWGPLYTVNTISMFAPKVVYEGLGYIGLSLIQLVAHASAICNPITYCFMSRKFRTSFISVICCNKKSRNPVIGTKDNIKHKIILSNKSSSSISNRTSTL